MPLEQSAAKSAEPEAEAELDPHVLEAVRSHRQAAISALHRWRLQYLSRIGPGEARRSNYGGWLAEVVAEARRLRDGGGPQIEPKPPEVELAAMETEGLRARLVKFLQAFGVVQSGDGTPADTLTASPQGGSNNGPRADRAGSPVRVPPDSPIPSAGETFRPSAIPGSPLPISPFAASAVGTPAAGAPTKLFELLRATLHGDALKAALEELSTHVPDSRIPIPSAEQISAAWMRYLHGTSPARDEELKAFLRRWGISPPGQEAPAHQGQAGSS